MKRRLLALLLALAMLLPTLPMGTLAEDGEAQETAGLQAAYINITAIATMTPWGVVEVDALADLPASEESPVYLVAASFDQRTWQMVDSTYMEVTEPSTMYYALYLYNTPENSQIRVFVLDKDLQSLTEDSVTAEWVELSDLDGQEPEDPIEETTVPEEAVETVPEETEETVPETTEETVPETTEQTAKEPEETLTPEAAAEEGYYVAPEGAQLQENAELEEMVAYFGSDKTSKGIHTASFTGLAPQVGYTFLVSGEPGKLDDLKYIWLVGSDANGEFSTDYVPKDEDAAIVQLYGPEKLTLTVEQDYITLQPGETALIRLASNGNVEVYPDYDDDTYEALNIYWNGENSTLWGISIKDAFREKLQQVESRYITFQAYDGSSYQTATAKVRVDLVPEDTQVKGAALGETAVTHNYYSSEATPIPVFLELNVPDQDPGSTVDTQAAFDAAENTGFIRDAAFSEDTPEDVKRAFEIRVQDDHTLLLATREIAETADGEEISLNTTIKNLKSSYNVGFVLTVNDNGEAKQLPVTGTLKLNVQKKLPTLKADTVTLNTYAKPTGMVTITGGEVKDLVCEGTDLVALEYNEENGTVTARLRESTTKSSTVNLTAEVVVAGYNQPVTVKIPVKIDAKAPTFKLEKTSIDLCSIGLRIVEIPVQCTTKGIDIGDLEFGDIVVTGAEGYEAFLVGDVLYIAAQPPKDADGNELGRAAGKQNLTVQTSIICGDLETPITWKITVNNVEPTLKLNKSSLLLNVWVSTGASLKATIKGIPENWEPFEDYGVSYDIFDKNGERVTKYFGLSWDGAEGLFLEADSAELEKLGEKYDEFLKGTYTLIVGIYGTDESKWSKVTLKLDEDMPTLTSVKAAGTIDLNNDDSRVTLTPTFKNKLSVGSMDVTVTDAEGNEYAFDSYMDGDQILIGRAAEEENLTPGTYTATVTAYWFDLPTSASTTFKVVKNKPTLKVTGKLDSAKPGSGINIYSSYRHYDADGNIQDPIISLASAGKESFFVDESLYDYWTDADGNTALYPVTYLENLIPAGKYTMILTYGDGGETGYTQTTSINITQTAGTLKLSKTSVTIHPDNTYGTAVTNTYTGTTGFSGYELYRADGKTKWTEDDQELLYVGFEPDNAVYLIPTGNVPEKDTTIKVKLTPDTRMPGKFSWLTVKVLGGKSLDKKLTLKATGTLDPSYSSNSVTIKATPSGFDNSYLGEGTVTLLESSDKGKTYHEVNSEAYLRYSNVSGSSAFLGIADYWTEDYQRVNALDPNCKYRAQISYGGSLTAEVDLKLAYGKNKFTVAQAPTLYKKDPKAEMDIHIDQQNMSQQIADVTIKGNTGFSIRRTYNENYSMNDWTLKYEGDPAKLKTTTLSLQIFLKSNETTKPNATVSMKVTVK